MAGWQREGGDGKNMDGCKKCGRSYTQWAPWCHSHSYLQLLLTHTPTQITRRLVGCTLRRWQLSSLIFSWMTHMHTLANLLHQRHLSHKQELLSPSLQFTSHFDLNWWSSWEAYASVVSAGSTCASGYKISHASGNTDKLNVMHIAVLNSMEKQPPGWCEFV